LLQSAFIVAMTVFIEDESVFIVTWEEIAREGKSISS